MSSRRLYLVILSIVIVVSYATAQSKKNSLTSAEANQHIGENATVCGVVASAHYAASSRGAPTFLNLDRAYPDQLFTVVIWREDRAKFGTPEVTYNDKRICVMGIIASYRGVPEIVVRERSQISVQ